MNRIRRYEERVVSDYDVFWIGFGDIHGDYSNLERIAELPEAAGVIITGDLTTRGSMHEAERILAAVKARNPNVYAQIGNMDTDVVHTFLEDQGVNIHAKAVALHPQVDMIAVGMSSPTPFGTPSEFPDEALGRWLEAAHAKVTGAANLLVVAHDPPYGTKADDIGGGRHVGSRAVRAFIERVQPGVCLTGHIHEARSVDRLGDTVIINPGMLPRGGYAIVGLWDGVLTAELRTV